MGHQFFGVLAVSCIVAGVCGEFAAAQPVSEQPRHAAHEVLVCPLLHAKAMPPELPVAAMRFTGPSGDGRRGSAGFTVNSKDLVNSAGTGWHFIFQRDPSGYGFQVIHPFKKGHVVVSVGSCVTIHRGGRWSNIGWGDPSSSDEIVGEGANRLPLEADVAHRVVSQLSSAGDYRLWIDETLVCRHKIHAATPLTLELAGDAPFWAGSSWDHTPFAGERFRPQLKRGHAGLILGPMDGAGPRQFFQQVTLAALPDTRTQEGAEQLKPLLASIDEMREFDQLTRSGTVGGLRGVPFEVIPDEPSVLVGFMYTTSRHYVGHLTIKAVKPIFRNRDGETLGPWCGVPDGNVARVRAREGYVVAGIVAKSGNRVDGMRLIFMRVKNGRLNPDETYRSKWIGGLRGGPETLCAANGYPVVGIYGQKGNDLDALGFVQADPSASPD